jgi:hypothetical protein
MVVTFPDGTRIRASSLLARTDDAPPPAFGLYLDPRWEPDWPADHVDWPDFGLPGDGARAAAQIRAAFDRAKGGEEVEVGCLGGLGRTGTVLACMATLAGVDAPEAVAWVRANYDAHAVETAEQEQWVLRFGADDL